MTVRISALPCNDEDNRVWWGPLQTRKDTKQILTPLYNYPSGIHATELET